MRPPSAVAAWPRRRGRSSTAPPPDGRVGSTRRAAWPWPGSSGRAHGGSAFRRWPRTPGSPSLHGLIDAGELDEADLLLAELVDEGMSPDHHHWRFARARLLTAQGDVAAALPLERAIMELCHTVAVLPEYWEIDLHIEVLVGNGLAPRHSRWPASTPWCSATPRPLLANAGTAGFVYFALLAARAAGLPGRRRPRVTADALLDGPRPRSPSESLGFVTGTFYLIAVARRADLAGEPSVDAWRAAVAACERVGAGHRPEPRLDLAAALLTAGQRDEARLLLPESGRGAGDGRPRASPRVGAAWRTGTASRCPRTTSS